MSFTNGHGPPAIVEVAVRDLLHPETSPDPIRLRPGEYVVTTSEPLFIRSEVAYPHTGTVVITLMRRADAPAEEGT